MKLKFLENRPLNLRLLCYRNLGNHVCPGYIGHDVKRKDIVFKNWVNRTNKAYRFYWRLHAKQS
jgi:hypothetical protein